MALEAKVSASQEDYLEAIYHTVEAKGAARAKDIVLALGVHNSSVTQALRALSDKNLINYAPYDVVTLTGAGQRIAEDVVARHTILSAFLTKVLGLPGPEADKGACRMEHSIDGVILDRLVKFLEYFEKCPLNDVKWDEQSGFFCGRGGHPGDGTCDRESCGNNSGLEAGGDNNLDPDGPLTEA